MGKHLVVEIKAVPLHSQMRPNGAHKCNTGPFVYRLGREIFIL